MRHLNRIFPTVLLLILFISVGCAGSAGTSGGGPETSTPRTTAPVADFSGVWQGTLSLSEGNGEVTMRFIPSDENYELQASVNFMGESDSASISRVTFEGNTCSFWMGFDVFGVDVFCKSRIEEGKLVGTVEVYQEGMLTDDGFFTLVKRG